MWYVLLNQHLYSILICNLDPAEAHLPNLTDSESVVDFFSLCAIGILSNVLDPRTYQHLDVSTSSISGIQQKA